MIQDLFGDVAEEKEVEGITGKLHEAKAVKSFDTFELISKFASSAYVMQIIVPLKEVRPVSVNLFYPANSLNLFIYWRKDFNISICQWDLKVSKISNNC